MFCSKHFRDSRQPSWPKIAPDCFCNQIVTCDSNQVKWSGNKAKKFIPKWVDDKKWVLMAEAVGGGNRKSSWKIRELLCGFVKFGLCRYHSFSVEEMIAFNFGVPKKELKSGEKAQIQQEDWNIWIEEFLLVCVRDWPDEIIYRTEWLFRSRPEIWVKNDWDIFWKMCPVIKFATVNWFVQARTYNLK